MTIQPYLFFGGRCEEAIDFYRAALGAELVMLMRYRESPEPPPPGVVAPGSDDKIMHAALQVGETLVMTSDGSCDGKTNFDGFSLSITVADPGAADKMFDALAEGGKVQMPMGKTFFSQRFGMVADRFGLGWMINVASDDNQ